MKTVKVALLTVVLIGVLAMPARASIPEMYTDQIQTVGVVTRVFFWLRQCDDITQACEWHYFGTDPLEHPPTTADPVNEYAYVQFPTAFDELGDESLGTMWDLAIRAGRAREGLEDIGLTMLFTDSYVDSGVARTFEFHCYTHDGRWFYFGSDPVAYPPNPAGEVVEVANVQFPRDFDEVSDPDALYQIGLIAGLRREGVID
jgi:hypothetical protein